MERHYKAIVVGSGAGGAPAAWNLARHWGSGVAMLEAGRFYQTGDFNQLEADMVSRLYARGGMQATEDGAISVLQGVAVGGSTVINDALCFRPPEEMFDRWQRYGVTLRAADLDPWLQELEQTMGVERMGRDLINRSNYLVGLGAANLGWRGERMHHNSPGCVQCGFRHFGCAYNVKRSMNLTYVPRAQQAGAELHAETRVSHLSRTGTHWRVHTNRGEYTAEHLVLAAGVVQTPSILLRSGIDAGQGLQFHVQTLAWGDFEEPVDGFNGIPMSYSILEFADVYGQQGPGYLIEGVANQPRSFAVQPQGEGGDKEEVLRRYRHLAGALMVLRSRGRGRIELGPDGEARIHYPLVDEDRERTGHYFQRATELFLAAGARRVLLAHRQTRWVTEPPHDLDIGPGMQYLYTPHPFGGAPRGTVLDGEGRVQGARNLWVLDASGFPEALGVNPQITIAALALQGSARIVDGG